MSPLRGWMDHVATSWLMRIAFVFVSSRLRYRVTTWCVGLAIVGDRSCASMGLCIGAVAPGDGVASHRFPECQGL